MRLASLSSTTREAFRDLRQMIRAAEKDGEDSNLGMMFLDLKVEHEVLVGDVADSAFQFRM